MAENWGDFPHYRRGRPALVEFHGFRSDTQLLERHGWRIAEEVDYHDFSMRREIRLILSPPCEYPIKFSGRCRVPNDHFVDGGHMMRISGPLRICVDAQHFTEFRLHGQSGLYADRLFREIDMSHTIEELHYAMDWGSVFPPRTASKEDVFLGDADMSVIEHLEAIKKLQAPKQKELRSKADYASSETVARLIRVA